MQPFISHAGVAAPLRLTDVDTDQIIPARFCGAVTKDGLGERLFADWRAADPDFILNREPFRSASILVAGTNFGSGSSREWAVWALQEFGFRAVLAPRYGDIFRGNAFKNGLLAAELPAEVIEEIWNLIESDPAGPVRVDLTDRLVTVGQRRFGFALDDDTRWRLLNGIDDIASTLEHKDCIEAYERRRRVTLPRLGGQVTR